MEEASVKPIGKEQAREFTRILQQYKAGRSQTERRIVSSENWWKLRNGSEEDAKIVKGCGYTSRSGWLHNVIMSKHADVMDAYPEPNILPREEGDRAEAAILSKIIPCVMEQNEFEKTYSDAMWQKLKTGTGVYKVVWDAGKLGGMGDIAISNVNLLNVFWEPGVTDIQRSRYLFSTELVDRDLIEEEYPALRGKLNGNGFLSTRFNLDENIDTSGKVTVVEVYYKKRVNGRSTLQYAKLVNDEVLYSTENTELAERGLYDHGKYPYVFDPLYPIEGSPCGYGFVDVCRNPQTAIDLMNTAFVENAMAGATPRFFQRVDGSVNEEEFCDLTNRIVHVNGNLGEDSLREIPSVGLSGNYIAYLDRTIQELRETSGNTETSAGITSGGVTAASAIAALQEAAGKGSRDSNMASYRAYGKVVELCIELIRQFYDLPRQFRIVGQYGAENFVSYSNAGIQPQTQTGVFGESMGVRVPVFDIRVIPQRKNAYTKMSQNELALQFYQMGVFNPQMVGQAIPCLQMMDFDGKDELIQMLSRNGDISQKLAQYMQLSLALARKAAPEMVEGLAQDIAATFGENAARQTAETERPDLGEDKRVQNARARSNEASQPDGGRATGGRA